MLVASKHARMCMQVVMEWIIIHTGRTLSKERPTVHSVSSTSLFQSQVGMQAGEAKKMWSS